MAFAAASRQARDGKRHETFADEGRPGRFGRTGRRHLKGLWDRWVVNPMFDEFARIDDIKGQTRGRGKRHLTPACERRDIVAEALSLCPVGEWILFDDFSRFMRASSLDFEITDDPWTLYVVESRYGSLGFSGHHDWEVLQGRYVMCVLFEYAATLGLIDIAYTRPEDARLDFTNLSSADSLAYLSRYDGLRYFRLNPLGAYCLELAPSYVRSRPEAHVQLSVYPDGRIQATNGPVGPEEELLLETYADADADEEAAGVWRLNRTKMLLAVEDGRDLEELRHFLADRDDQELPEQVEGLLRQRPTLEPWHPVARRSCSSVPMPRLSCASSRTGRSGSCASRLENAIWSCPRSRPMRSATRTRTRVRDVRHQHCFHDPRRAQPRSKRMRFCCGVAKDMARESTLAQADRLPSNEAPTRCALSDSPSMERPRAASALRCRCAPSRRRPSPAGSRRTERG